MNDLAACVFAVLVGVVVLFQIALIGGAPWGHLTMGGRHTGSLPPRLRCAVALQALVLLLLAVVVLARAGIAFPWLAGPSRSIVWVAVLVSGLSFVLNLVTRSKWERRAWAPVTLLLLASAVLVALTD